MYTVCVFCGSSTGAGDTYIAAAREAAQALVRRDCRVVYGGGKVGLMGVLAETAIAAGGKVVGVTLPLLLEKEIMYHGLTELHMVETLAERKAMMTRLADAFLILPGSYGTLDELFEVLVLQQLGVHRKYFGLLNVKGYYDALLAQLDHAVAEGFMAPGVRELLVTDTDIEALLDRIGVPVTPGPAGGSEPSGTFCRGETRKQ